MHCAPTVHVNYIVMQVLRSLARLSMSLHLAETVTSTYMDSVPQTKYGLKSLLITMLSTCPQLNSYICQRLYGAAPFTWVDNFFSERSQFGSS